MRNKKTVLDKDLKIQQLQDIIFSYGEMGNPPCFCCGYNGAGYFQPNIHPCAERHHRLTRRINEEKRANYRA